MRQLGRRGILQGIAVLAACSLFVACGPRPSGDTPPRAPDGGGAAQDQETEPSRPAGKPLQYPPDKKPKRPPKTPPGIEAVPVPSEVKEGEADYETAGGDEGVEIRPFEVPISLGAGSGDSRLVGQLLRVGLDRRVIEEGVSLVSAGNHRAASRAHTIDLVGDSLRFEAAEHGGAVSTVRLPELLPGVTSPSSVTAAHDPLTGRFLLLALGESDSAQGRAAPGPRVLLAVTDDSDPRGRWHLVSLDTTELSEDVGEIEQLGGMAIDENAVYVLTSVIESPGTPPRTRVLSVQKGLEKAGFYRGGGAEIGVH